MKPDLADWPAVVFRGRLLAVPLPEGGAGTPPIDKAAEWEALDKRLIRQMKAERNGSVSRPRIDKKEAWE